MSAEFVSVDGSPLATYLALPAGEAPMMVHRAIRPASSILELGSGPGRLTRVLVALGHTVTAVDDSPEMLEHVTGAERVQADVFSLDLDRRFDVVLAASQLINVPGQTERQALLGVCQRHLAPDGSIIVERESPGWLLSCTQQRGDVGPVSISFVPGELTGDVRAASTTYTLGDRSWKQEYRAEDVDDDKLESAARRVGLKIDRTLDDDHRWVVLVTADAGGE